VNSYASFILLPARFYAGYPRPAGRHAGHAKEEGEKDEEAQRQPAAPGSEDGTEMLRRSSCVRLQNQIESLLEEMQIKLSSFLTDLLGTSGRKILGAIAQRHCHRPNYLNRRPSFLTLKWIHI
jgi:hypothetical protein